MCKDSWFCKETFAPQQCRKCVVVLLHRGLTICFRRRPSLKHLTKFEAHEEHEEHESNLSEVGLTRLLHCTGAGMESWTELFGVELSVQKEMLSILY
jgi:hypothetical protein